MVVKSSHKSQEAKVSKNVIWQHFSNLKKKGVIVGSTIQLDYKSLGYDGAASFFVNVPVQERENAANLIKIPGVYDVYRGKLFAALGGF